MARNDLNKRSGGRQSVLIGALVAAAVIAAIAFFMILDGTDNRTGSEPVRDDPAAQRPTGAGTIPDGVADELIEGLDNETSTDDFIDQSEAADQLPDLLETGDGPDPQTDATGLEPAVNGDNGLDSILPTQPDDETN